MFLKLRANILLEGDIALAYKETKKLFEEVMPITHTQYELVSEHVAISPDMFSAHQRSGETVGFLCKKNKFTLDVIAKKLSFTQEIWCNVIGLADSTLEYVIKHEKVACIITYQALSEILTYDKRRIDLNIKIKKVINTLSLVDIDRDTSKAILRQNTSAPHVHGLHVYKAKFFPRFVRSLILSYMPDDANEQVLLDPFVGSGTAVIEGMLMGYKSVGIDIDKLSCLISQGKIDVLTKHDSSYDSEISKLDNAVVNGEVTYSFPKAIQKKFERWGNIEEKVQYEKNISTWLRRISHLNGSKDIFLLGLSDALTRKFNIRMMGTGVGRFALEIQKSKLDNLVRKNIESIVYSDKILNALKKLYQIKLAQGEVVENSATQMPLQDKSIDLIVTSPPYLPASSGREDYVVGKSISLTALGLATESQIEHIETQSIGSMKRTNSGDCMLPAPVHELVRWLANDKLRAIKSSPTLKYYIDLKKALQESYRVLADSGRAVYIIGKETIFYSFSTREILYKVHCDEIFKLLAIEAGFTIDETIDIELDKKSRVARPRSMDKYYESVIVLKKN